MEVVQRRTAVHRLAVAFLRGKGRGKKREKQERGGKGERRDRHGKGGHEGGPDGERVLLALDVDCDDLVLADVFGDDAACARETLAHALRAREHCIEGGKQTECCEGWGAVGGSVSWRGDKQNLMAPRSAWKRGSMKGSVVSVECERERLLLW